MPIFELQTPDGKTFEVDAPDENTAVQSLDLLQKPQPPEKSVGGFAENVVTDAGDTAKGFYNMARHPIDTANNLADATAGGIQHGLNAVLPESMQIVPHTPMQQHAMDVASTVGHQLKNDYGSLDAIGNTLYQRPVGALLDASMLLTGGGTAAARVPMKGAMAVSNALKLAGRVTNPINAVTKPITVTAKIGSHVIGMGTGTGGHALQEAFRAGAKGGEYNKAFVDNMRGRVPQEEVVGQAKQASGNLTQARNAEYVRDMVSTKADQSPLSMQPIEQAFVDLKDTLFHGKLAKTDNATLQKMHNIGKLLDQWKKDPDGRTPAGLDALKQRIGDEMPAITDKTGQQQRVVTTMYNAVKDAIIKQRPEYANAMKAYEASKSQQNEIERALSLGKKSSTDSALRKMQSIFRNNANTNYGSRIDNAKVLEDAGAKHIMPALAGQQLNTWTPRGVMKLIAAGTIPTAFALLNPKILAALPLTSPRLMGELAHLAGKSAGALQRASSKVGLTKNNIVRALAVGRANEYINKKKPTQ